MDIQTAIRSPHPVSLSSLARLCDANIFSNEKLESISIYELLNAEWAFADERERFRQILARRSIDIFTVLDVQTLRLVIIAAWQLEDQ